MRERALLASRTALLAVLFVLSSWSTAGAATSSQQVSLSVALTPERLGAGTTIEYGFRVLAPHGRVPSPLSGVELLYPANIGLITSGLGLSVCSQATLEALGPTGCAPNALMGRGSAVVEIPLGPTVLSETGSITTWMGPPRDGHVSLLFFAEGRSPVVAELIFPGVVIDATVPYGGALATQIPEIPTLPEAPAAAVVQLRATLGPKALTYYERRGHRRVAYRPAGIVLPRSCPRGGFPFAALFSFLDGTHARASTSVPCRGRRPHTRG